LPQCPNGLLSELRDHACSVVLGEPCFSIGGGFVHTMSEIHQTVAPLRQDFPLGIDSARCMLEMDDASGLSIVPMQQAGQEMSSKFK